MSPKNTVEALSSSPPTPAPSPTPNFYLHLYGNPARTSTKLKNWQTPSPTELTPTQQFGAYLAGPSGAPRSPPSARHGYPTSPPPAPHPAPTGDELFDITKESFLRLDNSSRTDYLKRLLSLCDREVLATTLQHVEPLLKRDPFKFFPNEVSLRILSYIDDPTSLARASQVSRLWYLLLSDDLTWKELCKSHHFRRLSAAMNISAPNGSYRRFSRLPSLVTDGQGVDRNGLTEAIYDPEATKPPITTSYRSHFKHQYLLNNAWNAGGRLAARYVISHPGVVTALIMDERYIVIALDNSKIYVFREDGKLLRTLFGHVMGVWALTLHGHTLVSGGCDRDVRVWDLKSGNCLQILRGHSSTVRCLQMVDANTAVSGSRDTTIRVWDLERGVCKRVLEGHTSSVRCLEVVGDICVSGSYDFTATVWRISDGTLLHTLTGHYSQIYCLAFDGKRIATGSLDSSVRVWDVNTGECLAVLQGHTSLVGQLQMRGDTLVTGGSDGAVRVWDLKTYTCVQRFASHDNTTTSVQFDDNRIVSGGNDGRARVWDIKTGHHIRDLSIQFDSVWRIAFRDEKVCILASKNNSIHMELISFTPPKEDFEEADAIEPMPVEFRPIEGFKDGGEGLGEPSKLGPNGVGEGRLDSLSPRALIPQEANTATPGPSEPKFEYGDPLDTSNQMDVS